jgi:putative Mn2+ efflux pump MntP
MKNIYLRLLNALIISLIAFISSLPAYHTFSVENLYAPLIAFSLSLLVQIKYIIEDLQRKQKQKKKPEDNCLTASSYVRNLLLIL